VVAEYVPKLTAWTYDDVLMHMGRKVLVTHVLERVTDQKGQRFWSAGKLDEPRVGWIVGCRTLRNGKYIPPSGGHDFEAYEPPGLAIKSTVFAVMVVFWPTEKPKPVAPIGITFDTFKHEPYTSAGFGAGKDRKKNLYLHRASFANGEWERGEDGKLKKVVW
jgi:hypothetical protein